MGLLSLCRHVSMAWRDMSVPGLKRMIDICHIIESVVEHGGKAAVHCHAGLGRTGLVIACYLVYRERMTPLQAIRAVRRDRPGSVQTQRQERFVECFAAFLAHLRCVLPMPGTDAAGPAQATDQEALLGRPSMGPRRKSQSRRRVLAGPPSPL